VTHHVELVLPGADYLVRMLDGRIDTQGTVKDLRAQGVLESITQDETVQANEEAVASDAQISANLKSDEDVTPKLAEDDKKPRKLIEDEHREVGGVKWSIYQVYLKASYVASMGYTVIDTEDFADGMAPGYFLHFLLSQTRSVWAGMYAENFYLIRY
jgi:hypothetical protein